MSSTGLLTQTSGAPAGQRGKGALSFAPERSASAGSNDFLNKFNTLKQESPRDDKSRESDNRGEKAQARAARGDDSRAAEERAASRRSASSAQALADGDGKTDTLRPGEALPVEGQELPPTPVSENPTTQTAGDARPGSVAAPATASADTTSEAEAMTAPPHPADARARPDTASGDRCGSERPAASGASAGEAHMAARRAALGLEQLGQETLGLEKWGLEKLGAVTRAEDRLLASLLPTQAQAVTQANPLARGADLPFPTLSANGGAQGPNNPALAALGGESGASPQAAVSPGTSTMSGAGNATGGINIPGAVNGGGATPSANAGIGPQGMQQTFNPAANAQAWTRNLEGQVKQMIQHAPREMTLRLDPAELGRLQIRVNMDKDGTTLAVTSQHAAVKEMIEASLPQLRQALQLDGLNLGEVSVDVDEQLAGDPGFDARDEHAAARPEAETRRRAGHPEGIDDDALERALARVERERPGGVDYFA